MISRKVTATGKDQDGDITSLCNSSQNWSPRGKFGAIADIESGEIQYYVGSGDSKVLIQVIRGPTGKYLRTEADPRSTNNLDNLPDC